MANSVELALCELVNTLASHQLVRAVGLSGGSRPFPKPGEGDIDIFIYCTEIPTRDQRQAMLASRGDGIEDVQLGKLESGHWGQGDCLLMVGVETWLLFFTIAQTERELNDVLNGQYLDRLDNYYYPIGRCAMWKKMRVLYDPDGVLKSIKEFVKDYPQDLSQAIIDHHLSALGDVEDLERATQRQDVLFFHFALDLALDHFLQAIFALNKEYFPSRKRSEVYIKGFAIKPLQCEQRLHQVVALGSKAETLDQSYRTWKNLVCDLESLVENYRGSCLVQNPPSTQP